MEKQKTWRQQQADGIMLNERWMNLPEEERHAQIAKDRARKIAQWEKDGTKHLHLSN